VRYVGVLGVRDKRRSDVLHEGIICVIDKKAASRIKRSLSFFGVLCAQVGSFYNIKNFKASSCITRAIRHPIIISNRLLTPHYTWVFPPGGRGD